MLRPPGAGSFPDERCRPELSISAIIPTLNESKCITKTLQHLDRANPPLHEILVVDGGSGDDTVSLAERAGARVLRSVKKGRAAQMNAGAKAASGEVLWFIHADTLPPRDGVKLIRRTLRDPSCVLGGFTPHLTHEGRTYWLLSFHNFVKTYYAPLIARPMAFARGMRLLFGDQAIFCRKTDFEAIGGYDESIPIMEDADLCLRMHQRWGSSWNARRGRIALVKRVAHTSARRVAAWGNARATYIHFKIAWRWYAGASPEEISSLYNNLYSDKMR